MKKTILLLVLIFSISKSQAQNNASKLEQQTESNTSAIEILQKLKISGYIQSQFEYGEKDASLKVGAVNENLENSFHRFGIRRGRLKFAYGEGIASGVFQLDITEKGIGLKDAYFNIKDPWIGTNAFRAGIFDRPFGYEIGYSSSSRESPERTTIFQTLFPEERDLGAMIELQAAESSSWNFLKLRAGLFAGNGIEQETDSRKDFIGQLTSTFSLIDYAKVNLGVSYYNGSVYQGTENVYTMKGNGFILDNDASNKGRFVKREYFGLDGQLSLANSFGTTQLRAEYIFGTQPGAKNNSKSPNSSSLLEIDTYIRNFQGGYFMLVQDLGESPLSAVLKYDWYDPNTKVSNNEIGQNETNSGDITYKTFGFGFLWKMNANLRLQAYYDMLSNETSSNLENYTKDLKDNHFTLRLQFKF